MRTILETTPSSYTKALLMLLVFMTAMVAFAGPARAATIQVTNTNDSGAGSLRQAVADANPGDEVTFSPSLDGQTITLTGGEIGIDKDLTITGPGADKLAVSGNNQSRIFSTFGGSASTKDVISGLTLTKGNADNGGAIFIGIEDLTIQNSTLSDNSAQFGGGIYNGGTLTVTNSTFSNNSASGNGGSTLPVSRPRLR